MKWTGFPDVVFLSSTVETIPAAWEVWLGGILTVVTGLAGVCLGHWLTNRSVKNREAAESIRRNKARAVALAADLAVIYDNLIKFEELAIKAKTKKTIDQEKYLTTVLLPVIGDMRTPETPHEISQILFQGDGLFSEFMDLISLSRNLIIMADHYREGRDEMIALSRGVSTMNAEGTVGTTEFVSEQHPELFMKITRLEKFANQFADLCLQAGNRARLFAKDYRKWAISYPDISQGVYLTETNIAPRPDLTPE